MKQLEKIRETFEETIFGLLLHEYSYLNVEKASGKNEPEKNEDTDVLLT